MGPNNAHIEALDAFLCPFPLTKVPEKVQLTEGTGSSNFISLRPLPPYIYARFPSISPMPFSSTHVLARNNGKEAHLLMIPFCATPFPPSGRQNTRRSTSGSAPRLYPPIVDTCIP
ncbi:hypothetical protein TRVL_02724 [Trypanosoma vivax]|nr:hypothetical protein TRVL_02724 [Trypanosoma vivax]